MRIILGLQAINRSRKGCTAASSSTVATQLRAHNQLSISGLAMATAAALWLALTPSVCAQAILSVTPTATASTVAGTGNTGYAGNNGAATSATFASPSAVAYDSKGDLFIADTNNSVIREVSASGVVTTVAGDGVQGFGGDGGPATSAELNTPTGIAIGPSGGLYIADSQNNRIRKVSNGVIITVAGNGAAGYSGDGGPATSAELDLPSAIAVTGNGNIFIADTDNQRIREVSTSGTISTIAGDGVQGFSGDGGLATSAELNTPTGVAVTSTGDIFIADTNNNRIREVSNDTITTVAGSGPVTFSGGFSGDGGSATAAQLARPTGVAVDSAGNIYIADSNNNRLREIGNGTISTVAGNGEQGFGGNGGAATSASLDNPSDVALNTTGDAVVADPLSERVRGINLPTLAFPSQGAGITSSPQDVTIANTGSGTLTVQSLNLTGSFATTSGGTCPALPISLTASQSCTEAIVFEPTTAGSAQGRLVVSGSSVVPQTILLSGAATQSTPSIALQSSPSTVFLDNPVTLTAVVSSGGATPTGTVTFMDGTMAIGNVPLNAGLATISVSTLPAGAQSITAIYSGSSAFTSVTSAAVSELVENFNLNLASGSVTSAAIAPGGTATYELVISPVGAKTFPQAVNLSASGLPSGAVATFSPATIAAGADSTKVTLTIQVPNTTAALWAPDLSGGQTPLYLGLILLPFADIRQNRMDNEKSVPAKRPRRLPMVFLVFALTLVAVTGITGCGSNSGFFAHQSQNYSITVIGTAGTLSHSTTVQLNVK